MRDIKDMSPETRARHLKHLEDTKKASKSKKSDDRNVFDLVTHMGDKPLKKSSRDVITSENRHDFMAKKLGLESKAKEGMRELGIIHEHRAKAQPHLDKHEASEAKITDKHAFYKYPEAHHEKLTSALAQDKVQYHHEGEM